MKIALAQLNPTVGDYPGNTARAIAAICDAAGRGAELVVLPELATLGYPPGDLLLRPEVLEAERLAALQAIADACSGVAAVVGTVAENRSGHGLPLYNAAALCQQGRILERHDKCLLPDYDIFDEHRYFAPGPDVRLCHWTSPSGRRLRLGINVCEDLYNNQQFPEPRYRRDPVNELVQAGADLLINLSASPFWVGKQDRRIGWFTPQIRRHGVPLVSTNQVGATDELIFDGASLILDRSGRLVAQARAFCEDLVVVDLENPAPGDVQPYPERLASLQQALVLGTRDYVHKCGFSDVVIGLSGGLDSAVTAAIAVEALGPARVHGVALPSRYSSSHSISDSHTLAANLGIDLATIPIAEMHDAAERTLLPHFRDRAPDVTEENMQARIRGQILMALSNKFGWLVLNTGNKSELAMGYCTLYGDMCGGLAVIGDLTKTTAYELAGEINRAAGRPTIPQAILTKPPSAELRPGQTDQDSLPPYDILDAVLTAYAESNASAATLIARGFDPEVVSGVLRSVHASEYKRRQAPPILKVSPRAFGSGWRRPIASRHP